MKTVIILLRGVNPTATRILFPLFKEKLKDKYLVEELVWGELSCQTLNQILLKITNKIDELKKKGGTDFIFIGKSFGGFAAVLHQIKFNLAKALILLAPVVYPNSENTIYDKLNQEFSKIKLEELIILPNEINKIDKPVLIFHAPDDAVVKIENSEKLVKLIPNIKFVKINGGGHSYKGTEQQVADDIEKWLAKLK